MQSKCSDKLARTLVRYHLLLASYRSSHESCPGPLLSSPHACLTSFHIPITREMISSNFFLYLDERTDTLLKLEGIGGITPHHILYAKCQSVTNQVHYPCHIFYHVMCYTSSAVQRCNNWVFTSYP